MEAGDPQTPSKAEYAATALTPDVRRAIAKIAAELIPEDVRMTRFLSVLENADLAESRSTLYAHMAAVRAGRDPLSAEKASGKEKLLTDEEREILCARKKIGKSLARKLPKGGSPFFWRDYQSSHPCRYLDSSDLSLKLR